MAGWSGFTEKDLQKLKGETSSQSICLEKEQQKPKPSKIDNKKPIKNKNRQTIKSNNQSKQEELIKREQPVSDTQSMNVIIKDDQEKSNAIIHNQQTSEEDISMRKTLDNEEGDQNIRVLTDVEAAKEKMTSLEKLQIKQKEIEEENKRRQIMIKETLAERMKQTQHESLKLNEINKQLSKLDQLLQTDVKILRDKIDEACVQFSHAQKRFQTAEDEYVSAKLDFYKKKEHKDQLQECLYTIIQENEIRKAKKLQELIEKLSSDSDSLPSSPVKSLSLEPMVEKALSGKQIENGKQDIEN